MAEPIHFHSDLYRREALEFAAQKYRDRVRVELTESAGDIVARFDPLGSIPDEECEVVRDDFCNEALSTTVRSLRDLAAGDAPRQAPSGPAEGAPPWALLAPLTGGAALDFGWVIESLSPIRAGAAVLVLKHEQGALARVSLCRNSGAPRGVAHTDHLDFMLMNGGGGTAQTEDSIATVLLGLADTLRRYGNGRSSEEVFALLLPHDATQRKAVTESDERPREVPRRIAPRVDVGERTISFDFDDASLSRAALYDTLLAFADRCSILITRPDANRVGVQLKVRGHASPDAVRVLTRDVTNALNQAARKRGGGSSSASSRRTGLAPLERRPVDVEALLAELEAADPVTLGLGFEPQRGPDHENLRVLNILGTGACNSACAFCVEKFDPTHRPRPKVDATRQLILDSGGQFDMLFFATGEPTIHPQLFEHVELAKSVGFTCFGMSSHFRTFSDPYFALKTLQAGFQYFDISLHAADLDSQLEVNPIDDGGQSLFEALKGLGVLFRLAEALGIRVSITQKLVVSRLNVLQLEPIFRATYDRGVRHFILQPVRTLSLVPDLQAKLAISEEEILPRLNEFLRRTEGLGALIKPYGFSRQHLFPGSHVEHEQNRVKNIYGKVRRPEQLPPLPTAQEERPTDGRHWVEVQLQPEGRFAFASDGTAPVLDDALRRGLELPYGCRMGACGMCCCRLVEGQVDQSSQIFLTDEQIQQGFVLMCQARPQSDVVFRMCTDEEVDQL